MGARVFTYTHVCMEAPENELVLAKVNFGYEV